MQNFKCFIVKIWIDLLIISALLLWIIALIMSKANASTEWTKETYSKQKNLVSIWFSEQMSKDIINGCKKSKRNPVRCIKTLSFIMWAESSMWKRCYRNNCTGMNDGSVEYSSEMEWINAWVKKFDKFWYNQKDPSGFYRADWTKPPTRYCMGIKKDWVCKEGTKNSWAVFKNLNF